jgi:hypothetical protein
MCHTITGGGVMPPRAYLRESPGNEVLCGFGVRSLEMFIIIGPPGGI